MVAQTTEHPAARLMRLLADPIRFRLLRELPSQPDEQVHVAVLARRLDVSDSVVSQHLRVLAGAGLVAVRRRGRAAEYFVRQEALQAARQTLTGAWPSLFGSVGADTRLSARNQLVGSVVEVKRGDVTSEVTLAVGDQLITGVITNASIDRLGLEPGAVATAVIKSTDVMFLR